MSAANKPKITLWEFFQSPGKTFMLPVALLSFCGIMLGIGSSLSSRDVITLMPFIGHPIFQLIFTDEQGRFLRLQLPAGDVRHRHSAGHGA